MRHANSLIKIHTVSAGPPNSYTPLLREVCESVSVAPLAPDPVSVGHVQPLVGSTTLPSHPQPVVLHGNAAQSLSDNVHGVKMGA